MTTIYQLAQEAIRHGGSPSGMSKWVRRAACGKKALLWEVRQAQWEDGTQPFSHRMRAGAMDHLIVGTYYHLLHEVGHTMPADFVWDARESAYTIEMREALRLYRAYRSHHGVTPSQVALERRWDLQHLRFEVDLEAPRGLFEGEMVTGRMDAFGYMSAEAAARHELNGEGWYIVDLKTSGLQRDTYTSSPQAKAYLTMAMLQFPRCRVRGMIFDQAVKCAPAEFAHYFTKPSVEFLPTIQAIVRHGARNIAVPGGRCNTVAERKRFGGCRCAAEDARHEREQV